MYLAYFSGHFQHKATTGILKEGTNTFIRIVVKCTHASTIFGTIVALVTEFGTFTRWFVGDKKLLLNKYVSA